MVDDGKGKKGKDGKDGGKGGKDGKDSKKTPPKDGKKTEQDGSTSTPSGLRAEGDKDGKRKKGEGKGKKGESKSDRKEAGNSLQCFVYARMGKCEKGDKCTYAHLKNPDGTPQKVAQEVLDCHEKRIKDRQARASSQTRASMITADAGISIAHVKSSFFTDEMFCLYDTGANCMVLPNDKKYRGTAIRCTLPGETVVGGHVIQQLSLGEEIVVKV
eukprot:5814893-Amphidinium_carterae.1